MCAWMACMDKPCIPKTEVPMSTAIMERPLAHDRDADPKARVSASRVRHDTTMTLRLPTKTRDLLDAAANATGKTRTEFVLDSARQHAIDVLLDQRFFRLDAYQFQAFMNVLDNPPEPTEKLKQLLRSKAPWEK